MLHEFKFSQRELEALVSLSKDSIISVTFCGLPGYGGPKTFYLCALSHIDGGEINETVRPIVGCPYPPSWIDKLEVIRHADLKAAPKFMFSANQLAQLLPTNSHTPHPATEKLVSATLDSQLKENGNLETFVTFTMKDELGNQVGSVLEGRTR